VTDERDIADFIDDMINACEDIVAETRELSLEEFTRNRRLHKAVIRDLEVLGEAAAKLPQSVRQHCPEIAWRLLTAMRNRLIHGYFGVDLGIVLATASADVPALIPHLRRLRARLDAGDLES
jgi:uncharacterized protein with HEPN domain